MRSLLIVICSLSLLLISPSFASDLPSYEGLCKKLVDLPGWKGEKCDGIRASTPAGDLVSAHRRYTKDGRRLEVSVIVGSQAIALWAPFTQRIVVETGEQLLKTFRAEGFPAGVSYSKKEKSGTISICLKEKGGQGYALLAVTFEGMDWQEALKWAKKLDWKGMAKLIK